MVTREEYIAALDVVEAYHRQLNVAVGMAEAHRRVSLLTFLKEVTVSPRLEKALSYFKLRNDGTPACLDEILKTDFLRIRNAGLGLWDEFVEKRDSYLSGKQ